MNYTEIVNAALAFANRSDSETTSNVDMFLRLVEAKIDRILRVRQQCASAYITTLAGTTAYSLPTDYARLRDVNIRTSVDSTDRKSLKFAAPEYFNAYRKADLDDWYYTTVGDIIHIWPAQDDKILEVVYYKKIAPLTSSNTTNWVSINMPDLYVCGLVVEILKFNKDYEAAEIWEAKLVEQVALTVNESDQDMWSGSTYTIRVM